MGQKQWREVGKVGMSLCLVDDLQLFNVFKTNFCVVFINMSMI